jgi:hypothetical protein
MAIKKVLYSEEIGMKKTRFITIVFMALICVGCHPSSRNAGIENAVSEFFEGDYEYRKTDTYFHGDTEISSTVTEGKIISSPYKEYRKIVESSESSAWDEMYLYGNGKVVDAKMSSNDEWVDTKMNREYPYGYGETLQFVLDREEDTDDRKIDVYVAEYTIDVSKNFRLKEELTATIQQEFFLEKASDTLIRIDTDLTDLNQKLFIANDISANDVTFDIAQSHMEKEIGLSEIVKLEVFNNNKDILIEVP